VPERRRKEEGGGAGQDIAHKREKHVNVQTSSPRTLRIEGGVPAGSYDGRYALEYLLHGKALHNNPDAQEVKFLDVVELVV
jgi:hypothetical protein